jgi:hypothetical protein
MRKPGYRCSYFSSFLYSPLWTFTGNTVLFVNETRGASDEKLSEYEVRLKQGDVEILIHSRLYVRKRERCSKDFKDGLQNRYRKVG